MKARLIVEYGLEDLRDENGEEMGNKQLLLVLLTNSRLTVRDGTPNTLTDYPYLAIGSIGSAYSLDGLINAGITHVLCLSRVIRLKHPSKFIYKRVIMEDKPDFSIELCWEECFAFIEEAKAVNNGKILVHCYQGVSRSATIICAYLIKFAGLSLMQALEAVRDVRPQVGPNAGFLLKLRQLDRETNNSITTAATIDTDIGGTVDEMTTSVRDIMENKS